MIYPIILYDSRRTIHQIFKPIVFDIYSIQGRNDVLVAAQKNEKPVFSRNDSRNEEDACI